MASSTELDAAPDAGLGLGLDGTAKLNSVTNVETQAIGAGTSTQRALSFQRLQGHTIGPDVCHNLC